MNIEEFRAYCLSKKAATECLPFDEDTLVFKVLGKMFTLTGLDGDFRFSVKVVPEEGEAMRERHPCVRPAYHMNKTHWVSVDVDGSVDDVMLKNWIDTSYNLVVSGMSKKQQMQIQSM
jgi:predicted DNA-binding protein (MmcQ/YjbR family)